jgi:hypothetical protein
MTKLLTSRAIILALMTGHLVTAEESATDAQLQEPVTAKITDIAWIAGHWGGEAIGGTFEETWNPPFGNSMVGMFKFVKDGKADFYELLTIVEENESLVLRLKHFDPQLVGWEEKDKSLEFPLLRLSETEATFDGMAFRIIDDSTLHIVVRNKHADGSVGELKFVGKRVSN